MHRRERLSAQVNDMATAQAGCISVQQGLALGLTRRVVRRLVAEGWLSRLTRGVYVRGEPTWLTMVWAGLLVGGPGSVIGGRAALSLHGLDDEPDVIDVWVRHRLSLREGPWRFRQGTRRGVGTPDRLRVEEAVVDAAADVGPGDLVALVARASGSRRTTPDRLWREVEARKRVAQRRLLSDLLVGDDQGAESALEVRYSHDVVMAHGLPRPARQHHLPGGRDDTVHEEWGVVVELDGEAYHGPEQRVLDRERDAVNAAQHWVTLRFGWREVVGDPCLVAQHVASVLRARGWTGQPRRCARCGRS